MWMLSFLPNFVFHLLTIAGVIGVLASLFFSFIPFISQYKLPIQVLSIVALVFGIYFEGGIANEDKWIAKVNEVEMKVAKAQAKSAEENTKLVEKIVYKDKIIKERSQDIIKYVETELVKYDSQCIIPKEFIAAINRAAEQPK